MSFLYLCKGALLCIMVSEMLTQTKKSPVMNHEAISYEEQYWYLPSDSSCWRAKQRKPGFSRLLHQIKRPSASRHFCLSGPGNNASGDNNFAIIIQSTCTRIIIWFALRGILHAVGIMNIIVSRRGNWGRRLNATLQATRQRMATLPSLSCQVHKELFFSTLTPWTYF